MQEAKQRRTPTIRARLRRIVLAPTGALIAVWLVVSGVLSYNAFIDVALADGNEKYLTPSAIGLATVMEERSVTISYLEGPGENAAALSDAQAASDEQMGDVIDSYDELKPILPEATADRVTTLQERYSGIEAMRADVKAGNASRDDVFDFYGGVTGAAADLFDDLARNGNATAAMGSGLTATSAFRAVDELGMADAQLVRSFTEDELSHPDLHAFIASFSSFESRMENLAPFLGPDQRAAYAELTESQAWDDLHGQVHQIVERHPVTETDPVTGETIERFPMPMEKSEWDAAFGPVFETLTQLGADEAAHAGDLQADAAWRSVGFAVAGSALVAGLSVVAFVAANRSALRLVRRLHRLRDDAVERTETRLPAIMERLQRNETVDVNAEFARSDLEANQEPDEIGEVAHAFDTAQHTAVDAAVRQAELRGGINRVFLNIAHRSQTLIHRQLRLLDQMERDQEDPAQLTELFKLDHLATRSRRNAENLLILGGENPGRSWHKPLPLVDVLRGAISESGDYTRVQRNHIARVSLRGPAVADVIHLVAELVDNATTFSPPHTRVLLSGEQVPNGVTIEIEDRGLGMQDDEFEAANQLLADPPEFDVMRLNEKMRLGLFVVSRLARRHDIKVWLRSSPYGGVQAIVLLPPSVIADAPQPAPPAPAVTSAEESGGDLLGSGPGRVRQTGAFALPASPSDSGAPTGGAGSTDTGSGDGSVGADSTGGTDGSGSGSTGGSSAAGVGAADGTADTDGGTGDSGSGAAADGAGANGSAVPGPAEAGGERPALPRRGPRRTGQAGAEGTAGSTGSSDDTKGGGLFSPKSRLAAAPEPDGADGAADGGRPDLPKRTPQTSLAPQLAADPVEDERASAPPAGDAERSERLRRNMAAFQQGTQRGRAAGRTKQTETEDTEKDS
ncbi:sensor histidine kinase [Nocardiopsis coralliicola]